MIHTQLMGAWVPHEVFLWGQGPCPPLGSCTGGRLSPPAWLPVPCRAEGTAMPGTWHPKGDAMGLGAPTSASGNSSSLSCPLSPPASVTWNHFLPVSCFPWHCGIKHSGTSPGTWVASALAPHPAKMPKCQNAKMLPPFPLLCLCTDTCKLDYLCRARLQIIVICESCAIGKLRLAFQKLIQPLIGLISILAMTREEH